MTNSIEVLVVFAIVALAICVALSAEKNTSLPRASGTASAEAATAEAAKASKTTAAATESTAATTTAAAEDCRAEEHTSATHGTAVLAAIVFVAKDCSCYDNANDYQEDQHKDAVEVVVLIKLLL